MTESAARGSGDPVVGLNKSPTNNRKRRVGTAKSNNNNNNNTKQQRGQQRQQRNRIQRSNSPAISGTSNGIRIRHREYISSISIHNAGFEVWNAGERSYGSPMILPINPGDGSMFPWLSKIAPNFEFYQFSNLKFQFSSSVSSFTSGSLMMSPEFDPHNAGVEATTLNVLLNKQSAITGNVWADFGVTLPKTNLAKKLVRAQHIHSRTREHLRQPDVGHLYVGLYNVDSAQSLPYGELFVEYDVILTVPNQTGKNVKSSIVQYGVDSPEQVTGSGPIGDYLPLFGDMHNQYEPTYQGGDNNTLGFRVHRENGIGSYGAGSADASRFTFSEPFEGLVHFHCKNHSGSMPASSNPTIAHLDSGFSYTQQPNNLARVEEKVNVGTGGSGADWSTLWSIVAKAGDIFDVFWDQSGTLIMDEAALIVTDLAIGLLPIGL